MYGDWNQRVEDGDRLVVLVVDDDPAIVSVASTYLQRQLTNVEVRAETSPRAALDRIEANPSIDCLVSDYRMPELDGIELSERATDRRPDLSVVLFTSVSPEELQQQVDADAVAAFVRKDGSTGTFDALTARVKQVAR